MYLQIKLKIFIIYSVQNVFIPYFNSIDTHIDPLQQLKMENIEDVERFKCRDQYNESVSIHCRCEWHEKIRQLISQDSPIVGFKFCSCDILAILFANGVTMTLWGTINQPAFGYVGAYTPDICVDKSSRHRDVDGETEFEDWVGSRIRGYEYMGRCGNDREFYCQVRLITNKGDLFVNFVDTDVDLKSEPEHLSDIDVSVSGEYREYTSWGRSKTTILTST